MPEEKTPSSGVFLPASMMYFCSGQPMHLCSGVDTHVVDKYDYDVRSALWRAQRTDSRCRDITRIECRRGFSLRLWDRQDRAAIDRCLRPRSCDRAKCCEKRGLR